MKMILGLVLGLMAAPALAAKNAVLLNQVSYNGEKLAFTYTVGGGCQEHTADVQVTFEGNVAVVKIFDTTPAPDFCQAIVPVSGEVNLNELIQKAADKAGFQGNYVEVKLPSLDVNF